MNSIYDNVDQNEMQKTNARETLNNIAQSHSIKDQLLKKRSDNQSLENVSENNTDGTFKVSNFL